MKYIVEYEIPPTRAIWIEGFEGDSEADVIAWVAENEPSWNIRRIEPEESKPC